MLKVLVVGCGSIGGRHLRDLAALGDVEPLACDPSAEALAGARAKGAARTFADFEEALGARPDGVVIASPSSLHYAQARAALERGVPVLLEKPMCLALDEARALEALARERRGVLLNGLNMRFHVSIARVKEMLESQAIGRVYSIRSYQGFYLPYWHPDQDYRLSYSANRSLGGGVLLDQLHELDYIRWYFGEAESVFAMGGKVSNLEIDTEDLAEILVKFSGGVHASIHLDYLSRTRVREFLITGENGLLAWDSNARTVSHFDPAEGCWKLHREPFESTVNDMYVAEMRHFLGCIRGSEAPMNDATQGRQAMELVEAARQSLATGRAVRLAELRGGAA